MNKFRKAIRKASTNIQQPLSPPYDTPLSLSLQQVSTYERRLFETQWIELNPFDLGHVRLDALRTFLHQSLPIPLVTEVSIKRTILRQTAHTFGKKVDRFVWAGRERVG